MKLAAAHMDHVIVRMLKVARCVSMQSGPTFHRRRRRLPDGNFSSTDS
jgi:hypothetical protein